MGNACSKQKVDNAENDYEDVKKKIQEYKKINEIQETGQKLLNDITNKTLYNQFMILYYKQKIDDLSVSLISYSFDDSVENNQIDQTERQKLYNELRLYISTEIANVIDYNDVEKKLREFENDVNNFYLKTLNKIIAYYKDKYGNLTSLSTDSDIDNDPVIELKRILTEYKSSTLTHAKEVISQVKELYDKILSNTINIDGYNISPSKLDSSNNSENPYAVRIYDIPYSINLEKVNENDFGKNTIDYSIVFGMDDNDKSKINSRPVYEILKKNRETEINSLNCDILEIEEDFTRLIDNVKTWITNDDIYLYDNEYADYLAAKYNAITSRDDYEILKRKYYISLYYNLSMLCDKYYLDTFVDNITKYLAHYDSVKDDNVGYTAEETEQLFKQFFKICFDKDYDDSFNILKENTRQRLLKKMSNMSYDYNIAKTLDDVLKLYVQTNVLEIEPCSYKFEDIKKYTEISTPFDRLYKITRDYYRNFIRNIPFVYNNASVFTDVMYNDYNTYLSILREVKTDESKVNEMFNEFKEKYETLTKLDLKNDSEISKSNEIYIQISTLYLTSKLNEFSLIEQSLFNTDNLVKEADNDKIEINSFVITKNDNQFLTLRHKCLRVIDNLLSKYNKLTELHNLIVDITDRDRITYEYKTTGFLIRKTTLDTTKMSEASQRIKNRFEKIFALIEELFKNRLEISNLGAIKVCREEYDRNIKMTQNMFNSAFCYDLLWNMNNKFSDSIRNQFETIFINSDWKKMTTESFTKIKRESFNFICDNMLSRQHKEKVSKNLYQDIEHRIIRNNPNIDYLL